MTRDYRIRLGGRYPVFMLGMLAERLRGDVQPSRHNRSDTSASCGARHPQAIMVLQ
ncbi:hypothetical protein AGR1B_Lc10131 [Agrobacterium fabacearum S56]|nr:hypothetical protein AGR1B_Lc10131 [Agrobacterium fabacearum S56]